MIIFLPSFLALCAALAAHLVWWKIRLPRRQIRALLTTFAVAFLLQCPASFSAAMDSAFLLPGFLHTCLFFWGCAFVYIITYTALEGDSPTLSLMRHIASRPGGVPLAELEQFAASRPFVEARLRALETDGLVAEREGRFVAAGPQPPLFLAVLAWRRLQGISERGG